MRSAAGHAMTSMVKGLPRFSLRNGDNTVVRSIIIWVATVVLVHVAVIGAGFLFGAAAISAASLVTMLGTFSLTDAGAVFGGIYVLPRLVAAAVLVLYWAIEILAVIDPDGPDGLFKITHDEIDHWLKRRSQ